MPSIVVVQFMFINYKSDVPLKCKKLAKSQRQAPISNWGDPNHRRIGMSADLSGFNVADLGLLWHHECHSVKITLPSHPVAAFPKSQNLAKIPENWHACGQNSRTCWNFASLPPWTCFTLPCPLDDEWGAAVSPIKPSGMPTTGRDCNELFCQQRGSECHTPSIRCLMAFGARLQDSILRPVDTSLLVSFAFL